MKRSRAAVATAALALSLVAPQAAHAQAKIVGGPLTNVPATGGTIHLQISSFPTKGGLYIQQCIAPVGMNRPTDCNQAAQLWISTQQGASFAPTADIQFKPTATFKGATQDVDCTKVSCGIYVRYDHTVPGDFSEDQFIALTFASGTGAPALAADEITATLGGKALDPRNPLTVAYRTPLKLEAKSKAGAALTFQSFAPACTLVGDVVTALKATGLCDIAVTSAGNATAAPITVHYPLTLTTGKDSLPAIAKSIKIGAKVALPATSTFGESVKYSSTNKNCTIAGTTLTAKKQGACVVKATGKAMADLYSGVSQTITINVKK